MARPTPEETLIEYPLATGDPGDVLDQVVFTEYYRQMTLWIEYTKGIEDGVTITPYLKIQDDPTNYKLVEWRFGINTITPLQYAIELTASFDGYILFDVSGAREMLFDIRPLGGGSSGLVILRYTLKGDARG